MTLKSFLINPLLMYHLLITHLRQTYRDQKALQDQQDLRENQAQQELMDRMV